MFKRTLMAATFLSLLPALAMAAHAKGKPAPPPPIVALYDGDKAPKGAWKALRSADLWTRPRMPSESLDELVEAERRWYVSHAVERLEIKTKTEAAQAECLAKGKRRPAACRRIDLTPELRPDPAVYAAVGDDNASGLRAGWIRHLGAFAAPEGWNEQVRLIRAEPDLEAKLAMAASWINERLTYYRRATDPLGRSGASDWFGEWSQGVEDSLRLGWGDCRDYALAQYALAVEGGVPEKDIAIAAILMSSSPSLSGGEEKGQDIVHIVVVAKGSKNTLVLSQSRKGPPVVAASSSHLANRGVLMVATTTGASYLAPQSLPTIASLPIEKEAAPIR